MKRWRRLGWATLWTVGLLLAGCSGDSAAAGWTGRVVAIHDGDTLSVLRQGWAVKLRLQAIDAPELGQPYGRQSRQGLSDLCYGRQARVDPVGEDKYGRTLANVRCGGLEANAEQLRQGLAWHYVLYNQDPDLGRLEAEARRRRTGLWSQSRPEPPWAYRHAGDRPASPARPRMADRPRQAGSCGDKHRCEDMDSCSEARYYLRRCGVRALDGDGDGVPCEALCQP